jgi:amino acid adenylation domain-containing protein
MSSVSAVTKHRQTTESQREIWAACQLGEDASLAYNESVTLVLQGQINSGHMTQAIHDLLARHELLRAVFAEDGLAFSLSDITCIDIPTISVSEDLSELEGIRKSAVSVSFDLQKGPLFRAWVLTSKATAYVVLCAHHIVCDGWSSAILLRDLGHFYSARMMGTPPTLSAAPKFSAFADAEAQYSLSPEAVKDMAYWRELFADDVPNIDLPCDKPRPKLRTFTSVRLDHTIPGALVAGIKKMAAREKSSFFMALLGTYQIILWKMLGDNGIAVAVPAAAQAVDGLFDLVGHCVNTLPIRGDPQPEEGFTSFLGKTKKSVLDAYDHQRVTFGRILQNIHIERDPSRIPLTPILFNVDKKFASSDLNFNGLEATYWSNPRMYEAFEIFLNVAESNGDCVMECQYNSDLFSSDWIRSHLQAFETLLQSIVLRPEAPLSTLGWAPIRQLEEQYFHWNQKSAASDEPTLISIFETTAATFGHKVAIKCGHDTQSYAELSSRSNQWAHFLMAHGVKPGAFIGVATERCIDMVGLIFGIFKAGACYVPLDPSYPNDRLGYMMEHSGTALVMTSNSVAKAIPIVDGCRVLQLGDCDVSTFPAKLPTTASHLTGHELAYVIFTSGSTGNPKGVMVPHKGVVNLLMSMAASPGITATDTVLAVTTLSFDISVLELYLPLVTGATVAIASQSEVKDGLRLASLIDEHQITAMQATPSLWRLLLESGWQGAPLKALVGGEALSKDLATLLLPKIGSLWNVYGPTETTVWSTMQQITNPDDIGIGAPIHGTSLFVVDRFNLPVPRYIPGELFIGGAGVTKGYLGRDDLTAERFVQLKGVPDLGRLYRTGDLVRLKNSGRLEYIGRNDHQVKVRGFRIELGEIEAVLGRHPDLRTVVVIVREDRPQDQRLVAYVESGHTGLTESMLLAWSQQKLPAYMTPQNIVILERMPLLPNGKINRKRLPSPILDQGSLTQEDDLNGPSEDRVAAIWGPLLGLAKVPATRSFYSLGGHSLMAMRMLTQLQKAFNVAVSLRTFMEHNTVRSVAKIISGQSAVQLEPIPVLPDRVCGRLSVIQERVYYIDMVQPEDVVSLLPDGRVIRGPLNTEIFKQVLQTIIKRHPLLRGIVVQDPAGPMMVIRDHIEVDLDPLDISHMSDEKQQLFLKDYGREMTSTPMDVHTENLARFRVFKLGPDLFHFATVFHHLIWDGWCFDIFWSEIHTLYFSALSGKTVELPEPGSHYLDFAAWHRKKTNSTEYLSQLPFWQNYLKDIEYLELPTDWPRPARRATHGKRQQFFWDNTRCARLLDLAKSEQTTTFMAVLAIFKYLLSLYSGQSDIVVGTPVQGRGHPDLANVIGYFVNTLVLRTKLNRCKSFRDMIKAVRDSAAEALKHEDVAFEDIIKALDLKPDPSRTTLYSVMFAYQDTSNRATDWQPLVMEQISLPQTSAGTDLVFWVRKNASGMALGFDYRTDLFSDARIATMIRHVSAIMETVINNPDLDIQMNPITLTQDLPATPFESHGISLLEQIAVNAKHRQNNLFLSHKKKSYSGETFLAATNDAVQQLESAFPAGTSLRLNLSGQPLDIPSIIACLRLGHPLEIRIGRSSLGPTVVQGDAPANFVRLLDKSTSSTAGAQRKSADHSQAIILADGPFRLDSMREGDQFSELGKQLTNRLNTGHPTTDNPPTGRGSLDVSAVITSADSLRWLLFALTWSDEINVVERSEENSYLLARDLNQSTATALFVTLTQWANLGAIGFENKADATIVVSGAGAANGMLRRIKQPNRILFLAANQGEGSWFAYGQTNDQKKEITWTSLGREINITRPSAQVNRIGTQYLGPYIHGDVAAADNGLPSWHGYFGDRGLTLTGPKSHPSARRDQFLIHGDAQAMQYSQFDEVLQSHAVGEASGRRLSLLIAPEVDADQRLVLAAHLKRRIPAYLTPASVTFIDGLPMTDDGRVESSHPILKLTTEHRMMADEPESFAEKELAKIWSHLLGVTRIRRHDNFFDLGGYSLLPLLMINDIEKRTGRRLAIGLFLTQNLSSIAAQCGFEESLAARNVEET